MKKSFLTVLFALFCTMGFAQLSFNVKAGLNLSSYIGENSDHSNLKYRSTHWSGNGKPIQRPCFLTALVILLTERCEIFKWI